MQTRGLNSYDQEQQKLEQWLRGPLGQILLEVEERALSNHLQHCYGVYRIHVGPGAYSSSVLNANMPRTILLGANASMGTEVIMDPHNLPLANDSVQALVIQHVFDISQDPHDILREAARVVMPGGRMIICGFNPYSSWGLWRSLRWQIGCPWRYRFLSSHRLQDWLSLLNFNVVECSRSFYRLPINSHKWLRRTGRMDDLGKRFAKPLGAVYVMSAVKKEIRLRNHKPSWRAKIRRPQLGMAKLEGQVRSRQK
ncbi:MAG: class I SAM-dependent methyltransferase [Gammaproteobacteria bacterium]|nr:class I SAM-dependent methyltransferase [Gammaproteobacteria bacterium]